MSRLPIAYVDIRLSAHATEDVDKVVEAAQNILPIDYVKDVTFEQSAVEGHYGNPITLFETRIKNPEAVCALIEKLSDNLSSLDTKKLGIDIHRFVEKGSLYIRLDKQAALQGKIKLVTSDPIRIRIRFRKTKLEDVIEVCREIGMLT